jgi:hypothetical protein
MMRGADKASCRTQIEASKPPRSNLTLFNPRAYMVRPASSYGMGLFSFLDLLLIALIITANLANAETIKSKKSNT